MLFSTCSSSVSNSSDRSALAHEIAQPAAGLEQRAQGRNLVEHAAGLEILDRVEAEIDRHDAARFAQLVVDLELETRRQPRHDLIEIVAVDLDEFALAERPQWLARIAPRNRP